jgi:hypothetical protein
MDTPLLKKLFLLLLSSSAPGEVMNARDKLVSFARREGSDIHVLAERLAGLSPVEMQKIYDTGYHEGARATESKINGSGNFHNVDGLPDWNEIALFCQRNVGRLQKKEHAFVDDMAGQTVWREPTEKQAKWLRSIFYKLGGKL